MADKKKKSAATKRGKSPATGKKAERSKDELDEQELDKVTGGKVSLQDIHFVQKVSKSSSSL